jgi:PAS domain S-box-containing protein
MTDDSWFRLLVDSAVDYAFVGLDPQGVVMSWNRGAELLNGYTAEEVIGEHFSIFYLPEDRQAGLPLLRLDRARATGRAEYAGWRVGKHGKRFWGEASIAALHDDDGRLQGFGKVIRDLTDRHAADLALARSESQYRLLVESIEDYAIIGLDAQGVITTWNRGAQGVKGYTEEEIIGRHFSVFYPPTERARGLPTEMLDEARRKATSSTPVGGSANRVSGSGVTSSSHPSTTTSTTCTGS